MSASCQRDELRTLFLFESLSDDQLDRLCRDGAMATIEPGPIFAEGEPATCLYVLLEGEIALSKRSGGADIETLRSSQRGAYLGAWSAFLEDAQTYEVSARAIRPCRMFVLDATCLGEFMRTEFPMACHFLVGQSVGRFRQSRILGPHDRLIQLGQLTAGLTHELNNPRRPPCAPPQNCAHASRACATNSVCSPTVRSIARRCPIWCRSPTKWPN